jgi:hypothetical protein
LPGADQPRLSGSIPFTRSGFSILDAHGAAIAASSGLSLLNAVRQAGPRDEAGVN